jgi:PST family polysaccharide transporter
MGRILSPTSPARSTAILAAGSLASLAAGAAAAKAIALLAGPVGTGSVGLLSNLLNLLSMVGGAGVGVAAVREVAGALAAHDDATVAAVASSARRLTLLVAAAVALLAIAIREPIAVVALGGASRAGQVLWIAPAIVLAAVSGVQASLVNGFHRVALLAAIAALSSAASAVALVAGVATWGVDAIGPALLASAAASVVIATAATGRLGIVAVYSPLRPIAGRLLGFGLPFAGGQLLGTGAQLALPFLVLAVLAPEDVGYFRAASTLSVAYLAFLLNAMAQDYYPRLAAVGTKDQLRATARDQLRLILALSVPLILVASAVAPVAVRLLYSDAFMPSVDMLRWQLIGDLVKLPAWVASFVVLAKAAGRVVLVAEALGGIAILLFTSVGLQLFGLPGAGVAYLATYVAYFALEAVLVRRYSGSLLGPEHLLVAVLVAGLAGGQVLRPLAGDFAVSALTVLVAAAWVAAFSLPVLRGLRPASPRGSRSP